MDQADRPAGRDRQPDGAPHALEVRGAGPLVGRPQGRIAALARFGFVQWEFPGRLGPEPGRYVARRFAGDDARQVLVIGGLEAPRRRRRAARARRASPDAAAVEVTRATVIDAEPLGELDAADAWLARAVASGDVVRSALTVLNQAVAAHRLAAFDPCVSDASTARALVCRVGYGTGEQVAGGEWEAARELPPSRAPRSMFSPGERVAAILSGRDVALACEELALRARGDLDHGRVREAALQLTVAVDAALAELEVWREQLAPRLDELAGLRSGVRAAADAALRGAPSEADVAVVERALARVEAALRARTAAG